MGNLRRHRRQAAVRAALLREWTESGADVQADFRRWSARVETLVVWILVVLSLGGLLRPVVRWRWLPDVAARATLWTVMRRAEARRWWRTRLGARR